MTGRADLAARITGAGAELPPDVATSAKSRSAPASGKRFGLGPGWLEHVTGVRQRRWASTPATVWSTRWTWATR
jgi:3-oxoacyl-[acyl-carrier-protein] synthase III